MNKESKTIILKDAFTAAWPIMAGYIVLGLPCGLLCQQAGINALECFVMSIIFYSGAGQYMIPNMFLAGAALPSIILSVSLVNSRQMLYSASLARYCDKVKKRLAFHFAATVTDESFGVNLSRFEAGTWNVERATVVNSMSRMTWALSNAVGALIGSFISVPTALASFAMTAIFICLLCMQKINLTNVCTVIAAIVGVVVCKYVGLSGAAILIGAVFGVVVGFCVSTLTLKAKKKEASEDTIEEQVEVAG